MGILLFHAKVVLNRDSGDMKVIIAQEILLTSLLLISKIYDANFDQALRILDTIHSPGTPATLLKTVCGFFEHTENNSFVN